MDRLYWPLPGYLRSVCNDTSSLRFPGRISSWLMLLFVAVVVIAAPLSDSYASCTGTDPNGNPQTCLCASDIEPNLLYNAVYNSTGGLNGPSSVLGMGADIVLNVFNTVNGIMGSMAQNFYNGVIQNSNYQDAINSLFILYVTIYGVLIMFNMASHNMAEVAGRLMRMGVIWSLMGPTGWNFFSYYMGQPTIDGMNALITGFSQASTGSGITAIANTGMLSAQSMSALTGPMTLVFSITFLIMFIANLFSPLGYFMILALLWGLIDFILMMFGALLTYVKAIVGLAFLFGTAPIFFSFLLFEKTRQIFMGWVSHVLGFFLVPVLLFAFLGFYTVILLNTLSQIMFNTTTSGTLIDSFIGPVDYCWLTFFNFGVLDFHWWRPTDAYMVGGQMVNSCASHCGQSGDWQGPPSIHIVDVLFFLLLTHIGKQLSKFVEQVAHSISGATGGGIVRSEAVGRWISNSVFGGRSQGEALRDLGGALKSGASKVGHGAQNLVSKRQEIGGAVGRGAQRVAKGVTRTVLDPKQALASAKSAAGHAAMAGLRNATLQKGTRTRKAVEKAINKRLAPIYNAAEKAADFIRNPEQAIQNAANKAFAPIYRAAENAANDIRQIAAAGRKLGQNLQKFGHEVSEKWEEFNIALDKVEEALESVPRQFTRENVEKVKTTVNHRLDEAADRFEDVINVVNNFNAPKFVKDGVVQAGKNLNRAARRWHSAIDKWSQS